MTTSILKSLFGRTLGLDVNDNLVITNGTISPETGTATATAGAATLNKTAGKITSESLTTAAGSTWTLTLTNSKIAAADIVLASVKLGSSTNGQPSIAKVTPADGSVAIEVKNIHASQAFNGTVVVSYLVVKA